ncbi:acetylornithine deacetylase [Brevibacillus choshinensis]|uniref:Acetylornithine deacetylase n=1 Tax=Brevibacillus choshinensis TaxID=54911 RepID=A0ABR5NE94_BRECH|nr:M20/M25/M40 family metallo-hydrolase [Brevibacillus choshinensis]KQL49808.1 acetylornithine deacetylase [Brevibacillus choshinensis]
MNKVQVVSYVQESLPEAIEKLKKYLSFPTVSAQHKAIPETVDYVAHMIHEVGGETQVLDDLGGNPVIYACFAAGTEGDASKTLLYYNHYDVQPPEPFNEWNTEPFDPTVIDGKLYARGAADNKGDLVARLTAIQILQQKKGGLPCNIKFLIEGEEEIGSPNLEPYLRKYKELFAADACIWEFGGKDEAEHISMVAGIKGMAYLELTCVGADIDMHSSVGAYVDNAAWRLVQALASMKNQQNEILVEGFFDGIEEPTEDEKKVVSELPFSEEATAQLYGLKRPLITEAKGVDPREAMVFHPTMTICGLDSGYTGEGAKTVLPKNAKAKVDCRLVPGQDPQHILKCIENHLAKHGFTDISVTMINGQKAYRSDFHHPFVAHVLDSARDIYDKEPVLAPNAAGTGPMFIFGEELKLPVVSTGVGWVGCKVHAPNESIRLKDFEDGIAHMVVMLSGFANALSAQEKEIEA